MAKSKTEPFKVTCKLMDGRINSADGIINLDAILYHAWFMKHEPGILDGTKEKTTGKAKHLNFGIPVTRLPDNRYAASCGFYRQYSQHIEYWNKRPDFTSAINGRYLASGGKIDTGAGPLKAYHFPQVIRTVSDIEFYGVGTISKIRELLSYIHAIGKKPAAGWGQVREWIVEPFPEDWSTAGKYGLMRPMPVESYKPDRHDYQIMECALLPPYWKTDKTELCYMPKVVVWE